jgi:hypothetical protein
VDDKPTLIPDHFYRWPKALPFIGTGKSQAQELIARGELEPPIKLSDTGRAVAFLGIQLVRFQQRRLAKAEEQRALDPMRRLDHPAHIARRRKRRTL